MSEDDQAGEWNIIDNSLETKEYVDIVSELRLLLRENIDHENQN